VERSLERRVLARNVVEHHVDEHLDAAMVCLGDQALEILVRPVLTIDAVVIRHVVAVIARRLCHRH